MDNENKDKVVDNLPAPEWYIIHTHSGHEDKVSNDIMQMVENNALQEMIFEVVVPTEEVIVEKDGKRRSVMRKKFPSYVFIKMIHTKRTWFLVANIRGVTGFLGASGRPIPLSQDEIRRMRLEEVEVLDMDIKVGDKIRVIAGPLENMVGIVTEVNNEKSTVNASVNMFGGRDTITEFEFQDVEKINAEDIY